MHIITIIIMWRRQLLSVTGTITVITWLNRIGPRWCCLGSYYIFYCYETVVSYIHVAVDVRD